MLRVRDRSRGGDRPGQAGRNTRILCATYAALFGAAMAGFGQGAAAPARGGTAKSGSLPAALAYLNGGDPDRARAICEAILADKPKDAGAAMCLAQALRVASDREAGEQSRALDQAAALLRLGKQAEAIAAVAGIPGPFRTPVLEKRANHLLHLAGEQSGQVVFRQFLTDNGIGWTLDVLIGGLLIAATYWTLKLIRYLKRKQKASRADFLSIKKQWRVVPLEDSTDLKVSAYVLSAYQTLTPQLEDSYNPVLLFVPPTHTREKRRRVLAIESNAEIQTLRPATSPPGQPASWSVLRRGRQVASPEGFLDLKQQQFEFTDALKELGVKVGGVDLLAIGRFFAAIGKWFEVGVPTLAGSSFLNGDTVVIALTRADTNTYSTVVAKSKDRQIDSIVGAAEEAVYKMLYLLGHENSRVDEADAAADVHFTVPELRPYFAGDQEKAEDRLAEICTTLRNARHRLSDDAPAYLLDRALLWESAAHFERGEPDDLRRAVELVGRLHGSEIRTKCAQDRYSLAVLHTMLGEFDTAHSYLRDLSDIQEPWSPLILYAKVALLNDPEYQKRWSLFADDVRSWRGEILKMVSRPGTGGTDALSREISSLCPEAIDIWRALVAAALDCPQPRRPGSLPAADRAEVLDGARGFFEGLARSTDYATAEVFLWLGRIALYTGDFAGAKEYGLTARAKGAGDGAEFLAKCAYVVAEAIYGDETASLTKRSLDAEKLLREISDDMYPLIPELRKAIEVAAGTGT
jgi:hypothetical protein